MLNDLPLWVIHVGPACRSVSSALRAEVPRPWRWRCDGSPRHRMIEPAKTGRDRLLFAETRW